MAVCVGFVRSQSFTSAWTRRARRAVRGRLYAEHRDGLDGALLGMLKFQELVALALGRLAPKRKKRRRKSRKRSSPAWDTRNVAAATTTPERREPDPPRACPAPTFKDNSTLKTSRARL